MLEVDDGVVVPDGCLQEPLGIRRGGGDDHCQAGTVAEKGLEGLGVLGSGLVHEAVRGPEHHGDGLLAAEHVVDLGHLVVNLVEADPGKVGEVHVRHGTHSRESGADAGTDDGRLADGGVHDPSGSELGGKALELAENSALAGDVLAHDEHPFVPGHLLLHGFKGCLGKSDCLHSVHRLTHRALHTGQTLRVPERYGRTPAPRQAPSPPWS